MTDWIFAFGDSKFAAMFSSQRPLHIFPNYDISNSECSMNGLGILHNTIIILAPRVHKALLLSFPLYLGRMPFSVSGIMPAKGKYRFSRLQSPPKYRSITSVRFLCFSPRLLHSFLRLTSQAGRVASTPHSTYILSTIFPLFHPIVACSFQSF